jgi:hypothetical protein
VFWIPVLRSGSGYGNNYGGGEKIIYTCVSGDIAKRVTTPHCVLRIH